MSLTDFYMTKRPLLVCLYRLKVTYLYHVLYIELGIALSIKIIIMVYELNLFLKIKYNPNIPINTHVIHEVIIFIPVFGNSFRGFSGLVLLSLG